MAVAHSYWGEPEQAPHYCNPHTTASPTLLRAPHYCEPHTTASPTLLRAPHYCEPHTTASPTLLRAPHYCEPHTTASPTLATHLLDARNREPSSYDDGNNKDHSWTLARAPRTFCLLGGDTWTKTVTARGPTEHHEHSASFVATLRQRR